MSASTTLFGFCIMIVGATSLALVMAPEKAPPAQQAQVLTPDASSSPRRIAGVEREPLYAEFQCRRFSYSFPLYTCFATGPSALYGSLRLRNGDNVQIYSAFEISSHLGRDEIGRIPLDDYFEIQARVAGASEMVLRITIVTGSGRRIYEDEAESMQTLIVSSDDLPSRGIR